MTEPSILFCTPCYGGVVTTAYLGSCLKLKDELNRVGLAHDWLLGTNESLVTRARNEMTASFLTTDHSHMCWIDADIEFEPQHIAALWNMEADIAVGVYAMKKPDKQWFAAWKDGALVKDLAQFKGPIEVDYAGTGFMLIRKEAAKKVLEYLIEFERKATELVQRLSVGLHGEDRDILARLLESAAATYEGPNGRVPALYMTPIHNDGFESEDYHFCRLAREAGFKIMMDPSVRLGHIGQFRYGA